MCYVNHFSFSHKLHIYYVIFYYVNNSRNISKNYGKNCLSKKHRYVNIAEKNTAVS